MQQQPPQGWQQPPPLYETNYMGFYIKVYPNRVEFKNAQGVQSVPINQIVGVQVGMPLLLQITLQTSSGASYSIPTTKKKEVQQVIFSVQAQAPQPYQQPPQARPTQPPMQAPRGVPIDTEIQRIKMEIEQRRIQLSQVNANMSNVRSHYQQRHVHGGGKFGSFVRGVQRSGKDSQLRKQQPVKERLQREKLALEQQLSRLKMLKAQGTTHITH